MTKKVAIQYRHLKTEQVGENFDLKNVLVSLLQRSQSDGSKLFESARLRKIDLDQDGSIVILNKLAQIDTWSGPFFSGQLIQLAPGTSLPAVTQSLDEDTEEFVLENLNLGETTQVLRGALYFAVTGNHVALIEGHAVKGRTLERYLTSLLERSGDLPVGVPVILNASFRTGDGKSVDAPTEISITTARAKGASPPQKEQLVLDEKMAAEAMEKGHTVFEVLEALGWEQASIDLLRKEIPSDGWIEGIFKFFIKSRRSKRMISRTAIDEALRNFDPGDVTLRGNGTEKNGLVKLSVTKSVETKGELLVPESAMVVIIGALKDWAEAGKIDCKF